MNSPRHKQLQNLLNQGKYFKMICGAGNEDLEEVKRLSMIYTLSGAKGLDISANPSVVESCVKGVDLAFELSHELEVNLSIRPFIMVSIDCNKPKFLPAFPLINSAGSGFFF